MGVDWKGIGQEIKRRREQLRETQDWLASKIGVRLPTIARLEIGIRRPSITMLERLAKVYNCRVVDLIKEKEDVMMEQTLEIREPSLKGAPTFFRACVYEAAGTAVLAIDEEGKAIRAFYSHPGWHLAIHAEEYLSGEALEELEQLGKEPKGPRFETKLLKFLEKEFPACLEMIPSKRRRKFMEGVFAAIEDGRFPI